MRIFVSILLALLLGVVSIQVYRLHRERAELRVEAEHATTSVAALKAEHEKLSHDIGYLSDTHNLVQELKTLFNFRVPGEELIVIVPKKP